MQDIIVIGGGVIGLSLAYELARKGIVCTVLDQGAPGQESSWAGAGMLPPGNPAKAQSPEARIRAASHVLWPEWTARLREETGVDNGFRRQGGLEVRLDGSPHELDAERAHWLAEGVDTESLSDEVLRRIEPQLTSRVTSALRWPEMGQVRNPRHIKALIEACTRRGVVLQPGVAAHTFVRTQGRIAAVETSIGRLAGGKFVVAGGAWSAGLLAQFGIAVPIRPLRGQIVLLAAQPSPIRHVVNVGPRYLVPRGDGRVLVGATEEWVGFDKRTTAGGVGGLIEFALSLVPDLSRAEVERTWAGLRPQSPDGLPCLGAVPDVDNLYVAAGHFRAGLQLSPITAVLMTQLLLGERTTIPLGPYALERFRGENPFADASGGS